MSTINTNVSSLIAQRQLRVNETAVNRSLERLSSGFRINRSADDAAGLSISENLTSQILSNQKALENTQDGRSILDVAEGGLTVITNSLQRMRELLVQAANDTLDQDSRDAVAIEIRARAEDIQRISDSTTFNGINLLDGSATNARIQVGVNSNVVVNTVDITSALGSAGIDSTGLGILDPGSLFTSLDDIYDPLTQTSSSLTSGTNARNVISNIDNALSTVLNRVSTIGSLQNRFDSVTDNLQTASESFAASNSRIRDLDVARESSNLARSQVLQQAAVGILAQANSIPEIAQQLLR